ncbi:hypothetical protein WMY93_011917 [Mugilogobius chulae]|uniref:Glucoside xylosyltransferase 2 n=1 Tax=Mugilogobius chulae TaxID=88201 RepID=A0AAW0PF36_9GOBI
MSLSFHSPSSSALRGKRPARTKCQLDHGRERLEQRRGLLQQVALAMRIHCRQEEKRNSSPSPSELGRNVAAKFGAKKAPARRRKKRKPSLKWRMLTNKTWLNRQLYKGPCSKQRSNVGRPVTKRARAKEGMHLAVVACGNRLDETLTMVKSALLFSLKKITFHIFAEDPLAPLFEERLKQWPRSVAAKFHYIIYPITFSVGDAEEWKKLFKPCAAQRLFLPPTHRTNLELICLCTRCLLLTPHWNDVWSFFQAFHSISIAAMAPEVYFVSLEIDSVYCGFKSNRQHSASSIDLSCQSLEREDISATDIHNVIYMYNEISDNIFEDYKCLFIFPCQWNYRPDHCMYGSNCKGAEEEGVSILHGNRGVYHDDKQPAFKVVYDAIRDYPFEDNLFQSLFYPIQSKFLETVNTLCGRIPQVFLKQIEKTMRKVYEDRVIRHARPGK